MSTNSVIGRPKGIIDYAIIHKSSRIVHNTTVNCGDRDVQRETVYRCQRDGYHPVGFGYPWSPDGSQRYSRHKPNVTEKNSLLRDALDSLNQLCYNHDRSHTCLKESGIQGYCLAANEYMNLQPCFDFICHHQRRDENLVHSLQCLHDTRLLTMLYFHIADRCRGFGILDDIMRRYQNAFYYRINVAPFLDQALTPRLYCLPKSVISTCIRDIVEDHCGSMTSDFVQNYLIYTQDWFGQALRSAGLDSNICDHATSSDTMARKPHNAPSPKQFGISRLLETSAPGTALDTVFGKDLLSYLQGLSEKELCTTINAYDAYEACLLSSDDMSENSRFNILQFAHQQLAIIYHGAQCSRLEQFTVCWNLLRETCGPKVQGLEQHATLFVKGCKIQSDMDTIGCHWQDMLLPCYIQASRFTRWPIATQCLVNPMYLDDAQYDSFNRVMSALDTVISLLQPGVEEISRKCGTQPAKRLRDLLNNIRYLQRDAMKYGLLITKTFTEN